ncbi:hypothetical protein GBF38_001720, partial [Nibea albiflora]
GVLGLSRHQQQPGGRCPLGTLIWCPRRLPYTGENGEQ